MTAQGFERCPYPEGLACEGVGTHEDDCPGLAREASRRVIDDCGPEPVTVKRSTLWDGIEDTYQTEAEINGFRAEQGTLL